MSPSTLKLAYKYCGGIPNLSNFNFNDVKKCSTCIKANIQKNSAGNKKSNGICNPSLSRFIY